MTPNRSRASSSANLRCNPPNGQSQTPPMKKRTRTKRGSMQATHSPASTPARQAKTAKEDVMQVTRTPEPTGDIGMTPAERYYKNLRVLRRRDPHIVSIFDQFAHVTVYYMQDDLSMERAGYEGTLFFFERDIEPRYGLFILNRQGMNDYIRYLLHDDVFEPMGDAVWISTLIPSSPNAMGDEDKTAGFWAMPMDVRETLGDMMMRLAPYIRRGERFPDEFRYGPDRAVPQQNYFAGETRDDVKHDFLRDLPDDMREKIIKTVQSAKAKAQAEDGRDAECIQTNAASAHPAPPPMSTKMSELDKLFSKLTPIEAPPPDPTPPAVSVAQDSPTGKALLDTMFASVSTPAVHSHGSGQKLTLQQLGLAPPVTSPPENMEILSPKPSAAGLPQILTTGVLDELMGLPSSDSRSASRSSTSVSFPEHPRSPSSAGAHRSKERGYVADFGEDDGGTSEASTNFDQDNQASARELDHFLPGARTMFLSTGGSVPTGSLKGDATPRARVEQLRHTSPLAKSHLEATQTVSAGPVSARNKKSSNQSTASSRTVSAPSPARVPFQSGAELWPSTEGNASASLNDTPVETNEVVELDFSEIGALDDSRLFEAKGFVVGREKGAKGKNKARVNGALPMPNGIHPNGAVPTKHAPSASSVNHEPKTTGPRVNAGVVGTSASSQSINVRHDVAGRSMRAALTESKLLTADELPLSKNAFVREVLTLIHTDNSFVEKMYQSYQEAISNLK